MLVRLVAGLAGLAIVLPVLFLGGRLGVGLLVAAALAVAQDEFAAMCAPAPRARARALLWATGALVLGAVAYAPAAWTLPLLSLATMLSLVAPMILEADVERAGTEASRMVLGAFYAPLLLGSLVHIHALERGPSLVFLLFAVTWLGDTGAYFAGRYFGRHKLFERVSPKKTWEGAIGGAVLAAAGGALCNHLFHLGLPLAHVIPLAIALDAAGVLGDLAESLLKRASGVKDSGWIMPGHGGILDRVDSLFFSAPLCWAYLVLCPP